MVDFTRAKLARPTPSKVEWYTIHVVNPTEYSDTILISLQGPVYTVDRVVFSSWQTKLHPAAKRDLDVAQP